MRADPLLGSRDQIAIGHSWGLANITSFEVAHTHYDKVVSLSGAGMLPDGKPHPDTQHADLSYQDLLQSVQSLDTVWDAPRPPSSTVSTTADPTMTSSKAKALR